MIRIVIPEPSLVLLIGAAGAGKSTFAARHFGADEVCSSDGLREVLSGNPADQSVSRRAFAILHRDVERRLQEGRLTVVDATNLTEHQRRPLLRRAAAAQVPTIAIVLDLPANIVRSRNAGRDRVVDPDVVERHLATLRRTVDGDELHREDLAGIILLRSEDDVARARIERRPTPHEGGRSADRAPVTHRSADRQPGRVPDDESSTTRPNGRARNSTHTPLRR
ncbi:MAG: AAA family ATPase [Chloroflexi bacterium]|nr:AAA family ATPase [Chloroflexota bacterium]